MKNLDQYILESLKGYKPGAIKPKEQLIENCSGYFEDQEVDVDDIENLDTSNVTNMLGMFNGTTFNSDSLDLSGWDVSKVTTMKYMFIFCKNLKYLDLSSWDVSNVTDMGNMFYECSHLEYLDLSGWDTSNVTNMYSMFYDCRNLIDIRFGPDWFNSKDMVSLNLSTCGENKGYKLSDETYESMLTMYDRKKAGLDPVTIYFNKKHNIPDGFKEKMKERGYILV
jgi:surface protein